MRRHEPASPNLAKADLAKADIDKKSSPENASRDHADNDSECNRPAADPYCADGLAKSFVLRNFAIALPVLFKRTHHPASARLLTVIPSFRVAPVDDTPVCCRPRQLIG